MSSIPEEYFGILSHYKQKWGEKTALLMQIGNFYEMFGYTPYDDPTPNPSYPEPIGMVITDIVDEIKAFKCDVHVFKTSKPYSFTNPYSLGFPMIVYEEKRELLLKYGYVIILCNQQGTEIDPVTKRTRREVVEIESQHISLESNDDSNKIVSLYIECHKTNNIFKDQSIICGISYLDFLTGENGICEVYSKPDDSSFALHEIYRFIRTINPKEICINVNKLPFNPESPDYEEQCDKFKKKLYMDLTLDKIPHVIYQVNSVQSDYLSTKFHIEYFNRLFYTQKNQMILEEFGIERMTYGRISYLLMINSALEHNKLIIQLLSQPKVSWLDEDSHLLPTHNAIEQLDLIETGKEKLSNSVLTSLIPILDKTKTSMGKRFLKSRILNPITDVTTLRTSYDQIDDIIKNKNLIPEIIKILRTIKDISKLHRKLKLYTITPKEFCLLMNSYQGIEKIYELIDKSDMSNISKLLDRDKLLNMIRCRSYLSSSFNLDVLQKCVLTTVQSEKCISVDWDSGYTITHVNEDDGYFFHLKKYEQNINFYKDSLNNIIEHLKTLATKTTAKSYIRLERKKLKNVKGYKEDIYIETTKSLGNQITTAMTQGRLNIQMCGQIYVSSKSSKSEISSNYIDTYLTELYKNIKEYYVKIWTSYRDIISNFIQFDFYEYLVDFISHFDFIVSNAQVSIENKYFKPIINEGNKSYFDFTELRHPIAEKLVFNEYITNDITLGVGSDINYHGIDHKIGYTSDTQAKISPYGCLLYGTNSCGKSTLAKAIGVNIIMAQAGCYTSGQCTYSPYKKLITRLSGNDNMSKGQSSFVVEMLELCTILRTADESSLILGDELSRGTENKSAIKLTLATIKTLIDRKCSFIFSTHLHELLNYDELIKIKSNELRICHLSVHYDKDNDVLVYDRRLKEGSGDNYYGINVAESLHLPSDFIKMARNIGECEQSEHHVDRSNIRDSEPRCLEPSKKSNYNKDKYIDKCEMCGSTDNIVTHHIKEQNKSDKNGFIGSMHKNNKANLIGLCDHCHVKLHSNNKMLVSKQTINGHIIDCVDEPTNKVPKLVRL